MKVILTKEVKGKGGEGDVIEVARGFANHYRRMVTCIVIKPFNPDETDEWNMQERVFTYEMSRLGSLLKFADDKNS